LGVIRRFWPDVNTLNLYWGRTVAAITLVGAMATDTLTPNS
jgi:hypothetical protein